MKKKNIKNKIKGQGNINMSLYEINQSLISQLPAYDEDQIEELEDKIDAWKHNNHLKNNYYMLLCRDNNYYTVLHYNNEKSEFNTLGQGVLTLLLEADYTIHSDEILDDHCEIWAKNETTGQEAHVFMLFPYDEGVVTYG